MLLPEPRTANPRTREPEPANPRQTIAQSCIDQSVPLVNRDKDFRDFAGKAGLVPRITGASGLAIGKSR